MKTLALLLSARPRAELPLNRQWLTRRAPAGLRQEVWLRGLDARLQVAGKVYRAHTADLPQSLRMGSEFGTCLTLRDGICNASLLVNCLDVNKQVLYLRDQSGLPVLRQLVAVDRLGNLVTYPVYRAEPGHGLLEAWRELVRQFGSECGLETDGNLDQVEQLHPLGNYHCDRPERMQPQIAFEPDYWRDPLRWDENCRWSEARQLNSVLLDSGPIVRMPGRRVQEILGRSGRTDWLSRLRGRRFPAEFWRELDYLADPDPICRWLKKRARPVYPKMLPVALAGLSFRDLTDSLANLVADTLWPDHGLALQALILLYLAWRRQPDRASLWRHLRRTRRLAPLLWLLCALQPEPVFECLLRRPPRFYPYTWALAAAGKLLARAEQWRREVPFVLWEAVVNWAGGPALQKAELHAGKSMDHALLCDILGECPDDSTWSLSRQSFVCLERGLSGEEAALREWAFRSAPGQRAWRLELLARLRKLHGLQLKPESLQRWLSEAEKLSGWPGRDLGNWGLLTPEEVVAGLRRCPAETAAYLEKLPDGNRAELMGMLIFWIHPGQWAQLSGWRPDPAQVGQHQLETAWQWADQSPKLTDWLLSWSSSPESTPATSAAAGPAPGPGT